MSSSTGGLKENPLQTELDDLDLKILNEYLKDSRSSSREIARRFGVSTTTVLARTRRLEKTGIIKRYTVQLDHVKLGYDLTAIVEITVSKGRLLDMEREIAKLSAVCAVYDTTGLTDAVVIAKFKKREELGRFTKSLLTLPFVERTNTHLVLTTVKEDFSIL